MNSSLKFPALTQLNSLDRAQWVRLASQHAPRIVTGLAVIGIAWQAAQLTWLLLTPKGGTATGTAPVVVTQPIAVNTAINTQAIADAHLFGLPAPVTANVSDPNNLPQSQMNLVLAGTIAFADPQAGYAFIGDNAANAKFYKVGGMINGAARLHAVYSDRIIIERGGALETVVLPRGPGSATQPPSMTNSNPIADNLRRLASTNPNVLSQLLRAQPVFANGTQKGYRVYPSSDRLQFARLGLQPGDLVTAINGTPLDDPNRSNDVLNTLNSSNSATVNIERNGVTQQLTLDMTQLSLPDAPTPTPTPIESNKSASSSANTPSTPLPSSSPGSAPGPFMGAGPPGFQRLRPGAH